MQHKLIVSVPGASLRKRYELDRRAASVTSSSKNLLVLENPQGKTIRWEIFPDRVERTAPDSDGTTYQLVTRR